MENLAPGRFRENLYSVSRKSLRGCDFSTHLFISLAIPPGQQGRLFLLNMSDALKKKAEARLSTAQDSKAESVSWKRSYALNRRSRYSASFSGS
jgi:hypothetical protein